MTFSNIPKAEPKRKPLSFAAQTEAVELVLKADFRKAFPTMRESERARQRDALNDVVDTLHHLTDW